MSILFIPVMHGQANSKLTSKRNPFHGLSHTLNLAVIWYQFVRNNKAVNQPLRQQNFKQLFIKLFLVCGIMHQRFCRPTGRPATLWVHYTTSCNTPSKAPEDGQNNCPKHIVLTGIINKPLLLHLFVCLFYLYFIIFFWDLLNNLNLFLYRMSCIS
jgi:hypothetical protein